MNPSQDQLISDFYAIESAVSISPHGLRKQMFQRDDFVLVDLRSEEEYVEWHIIWAVNIPAYIDRENSAKTDTERMIQDFHQLEQSWKEIITYCYSAACMTSRKVGKMLADHGLYVKHLNIGRNERRYDPQSRNYAHEWSELDIMNYIATWSSAWQWSWTNTWLCPIDNEFGC